MCLYTERTCSSYAEREQHVSGKVKGRRPRGGQSPYADERWRAVCRHAEKTLLRESERTKTLLRREMFCSCIMEWCWTLGVGAWRDKRLLDSSSSSTMTGAASSGLQEGYKTSDGFNGEGDCLGGELPTGQSNPVLFPTNALVEQFPYLPRHFPVR